MRRAPARFGGLSFAAMQVTINDERHALGDDCTITDLLGRLDLARAACAVEVNGALVPKRQHDAHTLRDGDVVEIVTLVGGG